MKRFANVAGQLGTGKNSNASHMRTGEIVDLAQERRLSAVLDSTSGGVELLVLNGGSRAEEVTVETAIRGNERIAVRAVYCIDAGTSLQLDLPLAAGRVPSDVVVVIAGGHGRMVLGFPQRSRSARIMNLRGLSMVCAAVALLVLAGGELNSPTFGVDPEPAPVDAPLVKARVSLKIPAHLPHVVARAAAVLPAVAASPLASVKLAERHALVAAIGPDDSNLSRVVSPPHRTQTQRPAPKMTDLHVPSTARSGDFVPVRFGAVGQQVKIVASIGPTIISKTIVSAQHGTITIRSPRSDRDSRVMTVRAYAQDGNRSSTLQAWVVLVRP